MIEDVEFDIQTTILKKKDRKNSKFYAEYDKLTGHVKSLGPDKIAITNIRYGLLELETNELIIEIFNNSVSLQKLRVQHDRETNTKILTKQKEIFHNEFDYIRASKNDYENFIYLQCDVISKKIVVNFISSNFMAQYSNEQANEHVLSVLPDNLLIYCIDKFEPSCLFGTLDVNLKKLFLENQLRYYCPWLPDDVELLNSIDFLHYNNGIKITAGTEPFYDTIAKTNLKPAVVYKQEGKKLKIQSVIGESKNFHLDDKITFYLFNSSDPGQIIDTINLNSSDLNNFNLFEINLNTTTPVKLISNYSHLHIEEQHANTDYQF